MKTICAKTNPDFKRTQLLPVILNVLPPTTGGAAQHFPECTPVANQSAPAKSPSSQYVPAASIRVGGRLPHSHRRRLAWPTPRSCQRGSPPAARGLSQGWSRSPIVAAMPGPRSLSPCGPPRPGEAATAWLGWSRSGRGRSALGARPRRRVSGHHPGVATRDLEERLLRPEVDGRGPAREPCRAARDAAGAAERVGEGRRGAAAGLRRLEARTAAAGVAGVLRGVAGRSPAGRCAKRRGRRFAAYPISTGRPSSSVHCDIEPS